MHKPWYSFLYVRSPIAKIAWGILAVLGSIAIVLLLGLIEEPRMEAQTGNWEGRSIEKGAEIYANNCASCHGLEGQGGAGPALNSRYFFTQRLNDIAFTGSIGDYVGLTVAAGRPSKGNSGQWTVMMPTWSSRFGGPLRDDQVQQVTDYVLNWETTAVLQTPEEDPWIPFKDTPSKASPEDLAAQPSTEGGAPAGPRPPQQIFVELGCSGCHNLNEPQTDNNRGPIGPNMANLNENAPNRVPGEDASTYVHNSIANPNAYVVAGYQPNLMPMGLADRMTTEEMDALVAWLLDPNRSQ